LSSGKRIDDGTHRKANPATLEDRVESACRSPKDDTTIVDGAGKKKISRLASPGSSSKNSYERRVWDQGGYALPNRPAAPQPALRLWGASGGAEGDKPSRPLFSAATKSENNN
jgi:hypothetical protein